MTKRTLKQWAEHAISVDPNCWDCGKLHKPSDLKHYDHSDGWDVAGFDERQWLYFECSHGACRYGTSFTKKRIPRPKQTTQRKPFPFHIL